MNVVTTPSMMDRIVDKVVGIPSISKRSTYEPYPSVFRSSLKIIRPDSVKIEIPVNLFLLCIYLGQEFHGNEFSVLTKGELRGDTWVISDEYVIPEQDVTGASVHYNNEEVDELKTKGFNTVLHSHPPGLYVFSGTDERSINSNFDCSLLFCDDAFRMATLTFRVGDTSKLRLETRSFVINYEQIDFDGIDISKIHTFRSIHGTHAVVNNSVLKESYEEGDDGVGPVP